jgi:hypothetical protein
MNDLRRNLDHLTQAVRRSLDQGAISENNVRMELLDVFEPLLGVMHDSVTYLQRHFNGGSVPAVKIHVMLTRHLRGGICSQLASISGYEGSRVSIFDRRYH